MHVHAPHDISVASKATPPTGPVPALRLLLPATLRTLAAGSSLIAREALNADFATFLLEILLIFAVLPLRHALVMMSSLVLIAHPMRVSHIECVDPFPLAEVDHLPRPLMAQVAHAPFFLAAFPLSAILQTPPAFGAFLAAGLQTREPPEQLVVLPFEASYASPGHDEGLACAGGNRRLVNFS